MLGLLGPLGPASPEPTPTRFTCPWVWEVDPANIPIRLTPPVTYSVRHSTRSSKSPGRCTLCTSRVQGGLYDGQSRLRIPDISVSRGCRQPDARPVLDSLNHLPIMTHYPEYRAITVTGLSPARQGHACVLDCIVAPSCLRSPAYIDAIQRRMGCVGLRIQDTKSDGQVAYPCRLCTSWLGPTGAPSSCRSTMLHVGRPPFQFQPLAAHLIHGLFVTHTQVYKVDEIPPPSNG